MNSTLLNLRAQWMLFTLWRESDENWFLRVENTTVWQIMPLMGLSILIPLFVEPPPGQPAFIKNIICLIFFALYFGYFIKRGVGVLKRLKKSFERAWVQHPEWDECVLEFKAEKEKLYLQKSLNNSQKLPIKNKKYL